MFIITEELTCEEGLNKLGSSRKTKTEDRWNYYMYVLRKLKPQGIKMCCFKSKTRKKKLNPPHNEKKKSFYLFSF